MIKKMMFVMVSGLVLMFASCGDQHKAQSLVKDFLDDGKINGSNKPKEEPAQVENTQPAAPEQPEKNE